MSPAYHATNVTLVFGNAPAADATSPAVANSIPSTLPTLLTPGTPIPHGASMPPTAGSLPRGQAHTLDVLDLLLQDRDIWSPFMPGGRRRAARSTSSSG